MFPNIGHATRFGDQTTPSPGNRPTRLYRHLHRTTYLCVILGLHPPSVNEDWRIYFNSLCGQPRFLKGFPSTPPERDGVGFRPSRLPGPARQARLKAREGASRDGASDRWKPHLRASRTTECRVRIRRLIAFTCELRDSQGGRSPGPCGDTRRGSRRTPS